jgi:hypothetical protein
MADYLKVRIGCVFHATERFFFAIWAVSLADSALLIDNSATAPLTRAMDSSSSASTPPFAGNVIFSNGECQNAQHLSG